MMVISVYLFFSSALTLLVGYQEGYSANEITTIVAVSKTFLGPFLAPVVNADWVFGPPFVKRFALCYLTIVCLSCNVGVLSFVAKQLDGSRCHLVQK